MVLQTCLCCLAFIFPAVASDQITVFAASSLTDTLGEITQKFNEASPNINVRISYASSGALARQIEQGAPADIFISANQDWMDYLKERQVVDVEPIKPLLSNKLVVVAQKQAVPTSWTELLSSNRFAMGDPAHVPAGIYAKQALENIGIWNEVMHRAVFGENVRISLRLVSKGEVGAAIVYNSDALFEKELTIVHQFEASQHSDIIYPMVVLKQNEGVLSFVEFLLGEEAITIFSRSGFKPVASHGDRKTNG